MERNFNRNVKSIRQKWLRSDRLVWEVEDKRLEKGGSVGFACYSFLSHKENNIFLQEVKFAFRAEGKSEKIFFYPSDSSFMK